MYIVRVNTPLGTVESKPINKAQQELVDEITKVMKEEGAVYSFTMPDDCLILLPQALLTTSSVELIRVKG